MNVRVIPRLDIKGPNLVKGVRLEGLRIMGKPEHYARRYYEAGADELIYIDSVASLYGRNNLREIVRRTAKEIFVPLTVGGGLRTLDDIQDILRAGADKVSINSAAVRDPEFLKRASRRFGSSTIVVSVTAIRRPENGEYVVYTEYGREDSGLEAISWARRAVELGAGELLVTAIDREGTGEGFDIDLIRSISESVPVPVIASGGAGQVSHVRDAFIEGKADAVALASLVHYEAFASFQYSGHEFTEEGNIEFLRRRDTHAKIEGTPISGIKNHLRAQGVPCAMHVRGNGDG